MRLFLLLVLQEEIRFLLQYVESHLGIHRINDDIFYESYYNVEKIREKAYFGRVHAISLDTINKSWIGSADPDWEGSVSSYDK
jgi:hypothetical protein